MSIVKSSQARKVLDRLIVEQTLTQKILADTPDFYARLREIVLRGEDTDAIKAFTTLLDRALGKPKDSDEKPKQALTVNIFNPAGGTAADYKITRYGAVLGADGDAPPLSSDPIPPDATFSALPPSSLVEANLDFLANPSPPPPAKKDV